MLYTQQFMDVKTLQTINLINRFYIKINYFINYIHGKKNIILLIKTSSFLLCLNLNTYTYLKLMIFGIFLVINLYYYYFV
jgi:hypothetical protein